MKLKDLKKTYLNEVSNDEELKNIKKQVNLKKHFHFLQIFPYIFSTISVVVIAILLCIIFIDTAKVTFLSLAASSKVKQEMRLNVKETNNQVMDFDYYFTPDEEIVLSIELSNPDQYEILSVEINNIKMSGKYSFQYMKNLIINNSDLNTKDAFWHSKNVLVESSYIKGEYLGWYSNNLTFKNCIIEGTQPLCYCKNLKLIDCEFKNCDLAFEYSEVNGNILGGIDSIKNPLKGSIKIEKRSEIILTKNSKHKDACNIIFLD